MLFGGIDGDATEGLRKIEASLHKSEIYRTKYNVPKHNEFQYECYGKVRSRRSLKTVEHA